MGQQDKCLPKYVRSEFEAYLKCGRLEYGFLRVRCEDCHHEHLVAFSWPLLRIHAHAAFVHPARHHAEGFDVVCQTQLRCAANGIKRRLAG
jgi:ribosomal protein S27E